MSTSVVPGIVGNVKLLDKRDIIYYSMDYKAFKYIRGNRNISQKHVSELISKINNTKYIKPIEVSPDMIVLDGQHRLEAAQLLQMPIPFFYVPVKDEEEVRKFIGVLNSTMLNWELEDFMNSYEIQGKQSYVIFKKLFLQYDFPISFMVSISIGKPGVHGGHGSEIFKKGKMELSPEQATKVQNLAGDIREIQGLWDGWKYFSNSARFLYGLTKCMVHPMYSQERMISSLERDPDHLRKAFSTEGYVYEFNNIYNTGWPGANHLNFSDVVKTSQMYSDVEIKMKAEKKKKRKINKKIGVTNV